MTQTVATVLQDVLHSHGETEIAEAFAATEAQFPGFCNNFLKEFLIIGMKLFFCVYIHISISLCVYFFCTFVSSFGAFSSNPFRESHVFRFPKYALVILFLFLLFYFLIIIRWRVSSVCKRRSLRWIIPIARSYTVCYFLSRSVGCPCFSSSSTIYKCKTPFLLFSTRIFL